MTGVYEPYVRFDGPDSATMARGGDNELPGLADVQDESAATTAGLAVEIARATAAETLEIGLRAAADLSEATDRANADTAISALITEIETDLGELVTADTALDGRVTALEALRSWIDVLAVAQQLTSNSTTFQNVTHLRLPITGSSAWRFSITLIFLSSVAADFKFQFTVPAGAVVFFSTSSFSAGGGPTEYGSVYAATPIMADGVAGTNVAIELTGTVVGGGTAGDLQLQAAQNTGTVENTDFVVAGSNIVGTRVL